MRRLEHYTELLSVSQKKDEEFEMLKESNSWSIWIVLFAGTRNNVASAFCAIKNKNAELWIWSWFFSRLKFLHANIRCTSDA